MNIKIQKRCKFIKFAILKNSAKKGTRTFFCAKRCKFKIKYVDIRFKDQNHIKSLSI